MAPIFTTLAVLLGTTHILFAGILDTKVPWSGKIRRSNFSSELARLQELSEKQGHQGLQLTESVSQKTAAAKVRDLIIADSPRPTYHDVLVELFKQAGEQVVLEETEKGVDVTYLYTVTFSLRFSVQEKLSSSKQLNSDGLLATLKAKGFEPSEHVEILLVSATKTVVVKGTRKDGANASRHLGYH